MEQIEQYIQQIEKTLKELKEIREKDKEKASFEQLVSEKLNQMSKDMEDIKKAIV